MKKSSTPNETIIEKLDTIIKFQKISLVLQLYSEGASQDQIAKTLGVAKKTVNIMLKGINKKVTSKHG